MQITVVGRHFDVTEPIKRYVDGKLLKLERFSEKLKGGHVILEIQKFRHIAEITLFLKYVKLTATQESPDMYASIDKAVDNLHKQLLRLNERIKEHKARRPQRGSIFRKFFGIGREDDEAGPQQKPRVVEREFETKPMSVDEACMELDLFKDKFLVFRDSRTDKVNVVYKMDDGNYGLVVPK